MDLSTIKLEYNHKISFDLVDEQVENYVRTKAVSINSIFTKQNEKKYI